MLQVSNQEEKVSRFTSSTNRLVFFGEEIQAQHHWYRIFLNDE